MKSLSLPVIAIAMLFSVPACDLAELRPANGEPGFLNTTWHLAAFEENGEVRTIVDDGRSYWIRFLPDGSAAIRADCNTCGAAYTRGRGDSLSITPPMCTRIFCGEESFDTPFVEGLRQAESHSKEGRVLRIYYDEGRKALQLRAR